MSKRRGSHFGVGAPPILEPILVGIGMFTGGTIWVAVVGLEDQCVVAWLRKLGGLLQGLSIFGRPRDITQSWLTCLLILVQELA